MSIHILQVYMQYIEYIFYCIYILLYVFLPIALYLYNNIGSTTWLLEQECILSDLYKNPQMFRSAGVTDLVQTSNDAQTQSH